MNKTTYITTSIPYVNSRPHIGHALEMVQADVIARYNRLRQNPTRFQTGTDENAWKNVVSARNQGVTVQELVDYNSSLFQKLAAALNISSDRFIRTTESGHRQGVQYFWQRLKPGDIYLKKYRGLYCIGCEDFFLEKNLQEGRCPDHGTEPVVVEEENYFFRLSAYQCRIAEILEENRIKIIPDWRRNEILTFVKTGLLDISISRSSWRSGGWGIRVPDDPSQVIYVWIDALINYLSGLGYSSNMQWEQYWNIEARKIHVIGKNIWKFHAVYWPALLISAGLALPDEIVIHGFVTENGQKISKSRGNPFDPAALIHEYGSDAVRYYLLRGLSPFTDGDFSLERFISLYNADLANGLGNLVSRITTLCRTAGFTGQEFPDIPEAPEGYSANLERYEYDGALKVLWDIITRLNRDLDRKQPWKSLKSGHVIDVRQQLTGWLRDLQVIAWWLSPFLPATGESILAIIARKPIMITKPLFPRIDNRRT
jgi:methionyl-tRNA synthetase